MVAFRESTKALNIQYKPLYIWTDTNKNSAFVQINARDEQK